MAIDTLGANALASDSVTTAKIVDDAVTNAKIGANAVGTTEVADDAVTGAKIENSPTIANGLTLTDGNITVAGGHGINFAADANATGMSSEVFDDYEEGSFTPVFGGSGGNPTVSHALQLGTYVRIGQLVYVNVSVIASGTPSGGSGDLIITGLPFSSKAGVQQCGSIAFANTITFGSSVTDGGCNIEGNVAYLNINNQEYSGTSAMGRVQASGIHHSNPRIVCSICYEVA